MKVTQEGSAFRPMTIVLETPGEVRYMDVLLNIRKGDALKASQSTASADSVASRISMRDTFANAV